MNEKEKPEGLTPAGEISAPLDDIAAPREALSGPETSSPAAPGGYAPPPTPPFSATLPEILSALACYLLGWYYFDMYSKPGWLLAFVLAFIALTEWLHRGTGRPRESWVWLGCVVTITAALALDRCNAWEFDAWPWLFLHIFAVWWLLSRGGRLAEGESGHLLPYDALNGFVIFPFKHFFLRVRSLWYGLTRLGRGERRLGAVKLLWSLGAILVVLVLLVHAADLLTQADTGFDSFLTRLGNWLSFDFSWTRLFFSLPVGAYIFGLIAGSAREDAAVTRARGARIMRELAGLREVPTAVFSAALAVFALFYLSFFALQGSYLFGAFTRTLPEGFVVAEYARQGFFELCRVMALNFALLWLCARFAGRTLRDSRLLRILAAVLLAESLLFAVVAASKLGLYIDCFGFTPKRLQAAWLVTVLAAGCGCTLFTLFTGKKSFRAWMIFGAVTVSLLCLY